MNFKFLNAIFFIFLASLCFVNAQTLPGGEYDDYETQKKKKTKNSTFFHIGAKLENLDSEPLYMIGLRVGDYSLNNPLRIGGSVYTTISTSNKASLQLSSSLKEPITITKASFDLYYDVLASEAFRLSIANGIGLGLVNFEQSQGVQTETQMGFFALIEPQIFVTFNLGKGFDLDFGTSYILSSGSTPLEISSKELSGFSAFIGVKFW